MSAEKLLEFQKTYPDGTAHSDGGCTFVSIPILKLGADGVETEYAALLCPQSHSGYLTRLFLNRQVPEKGRNWNSFPILGGTWWSCSLQGISPDQSYLSILLAHMGHLQ